MTRISLIFIQIVRVLLTASAGLALAACSLLDGSSSDDRAWNTWVDSLYQRLDRRDSTMAIVALDNARAYAHTDRQRTVLSACDAILSSYDIEQFLDLISYFESAPSRVGSDSTEILSCEDGLLTRLCDKAAAIAELRSDIPLAVKLQSKAADASRRSGHWISYVSTQSRLLTLYERAGDCDAAVTGYIALLNECHDRHDSNGAFEILYRLCHFFLRVGDVSTAQIYLDEMESLQVTSPMSECKYWLAQASVCRYGTDSATYERAVKSLINLKQSDRTIAKAFGIAIDCIVADYFIDTNHPDLARKTIQYVIAPAARAAQREATPTYINILEAKICIKEGNLQRAKEIITSIDPKILKQKDINLYGPYTDAASSYYAAAGQDKMAFDYTQRKFAIRDSLHLELTTHGVAFMSLESRRDTAIVNKYNRLTKAETNVENIIRRQYFWLGAAVLSVVLAIAIYYISSLRRIRRRNQELERKRDELTDDVRRRRSFILEHKSQLEAKNSAMQSELSFAKNIQSNTLSREDILSSPGVAEHFIFFRPCFQVSGDFYWFYDTGDRLFVCAADATGHGIPGAFVSMVASTILTDIASSSERLTPSALLEELSVSLTNIMRNNSDIVNADSVDMSVLCIDREQKTLTLSLARHVAYIVKADGSFKLIQGVKRCVGEVIDVEDGRPFVDVTLDLEKGDCIYLASDGYVSQFGGPANQKFKRKRMEDMLVEVHNLNAATQKEIIEQRFDEWKGSLDQTDDVLVVGLRIGSLD